MQSFKELDLRPEIQDALAGIGFETPTPIQVQAIPHILQSDEDLIAYAQTGTGKTAAFSLPILERVDLTARHVQAIVLCPTRELALQISTDLQAFGSNLKGLRHTAVYGGASIQDQITKIRKGSQIIVGTPGRTLDLIRRGVLKLDAIQWVVLDEADEMLSMGFAKDLREILSKTPEEKQTLLFSATIPPEMRKIADAYMHAPREINAGSRKVSSTNVRHLYTVVNARQRFEALRRMIDVHPDLYGIVFCRTRRETSNLAAKLAKSGYRTDVLNGDLSQNQRDQVMKRFRDRQIQLLVATDIAARGLDVDELTHVFHYSLPDELDVYVHRSGRTGRAGNEGMSILLLTRKDQSRLRFIEQKIGRKMERVGVPRPEQIMRRHGKGLAQKMLEAKALPESMHKALEEMEAQLQDLSKTEVLERMLSLALEDMAKAYEEIPEDTGFDQADSAEQGPERRKERGAQPQGMETFYINLGKKQKFTATLLLKLINESVDGERPDVGHISIQKTFSSFQIPPRYTGDLIKNLDNVQFKGRQVFIQPATELNRVKKSGFSAKKKSRNYGGRNKQRA